MPNVPCLEDPGRIVAHRGASGDAPENTLSAFRIAAEQGARWIEFDVSVLGDNTPVVIHDATLDRCTSGSGSLRDLAVEDLSAVDAGAWFSDSFTGERVPTLDQTLDEIERLGVFANLELKPHGAHPEGLVDAVVERLRRRPASAARIIVSSFDHRALGALRGALPDMPIALLYDVPGQDWVFTARRLGAAALHVSASGVSRPLLRDAAARGLDVRVYTVNDVATLAPYRDAGLTGVITDVPGLFLDDPGWGPWADRQSA